MWVVVLAITMMTLQNYYAMSTHNHVTGSSGGSPLQALVDHHPIVTDFHNFCDGARMHAINWLGN